MMRLLAPLVLALTFLVWISYRLFIKRDIKNHLNEIYGGAFFFAVWGVIYWMIL